MSAKPASMKKASKLAANIRAIGLLQNLQVRQTGNGKYEGFWEILDCPDDHYTMATAFHEWQFHLE